MIRGLKGKVSHIRKLASASGTQDPKAGVALNQLHTKWIGRWKDAFGNGSLHPNKQTATAENHKEKPFYCLSMFPYPSGVLHLGHQRVYTISDVISRYMRLKGREVIHPMGWDAFGLPAENAAVERGINPADWTESNIGKMKQQMELMLADFDWDREVDTSSPEYYRWTQKVFTLLFEKGLAHRKGAEINWDPVDQTVLANEQVDSNGRSWRSGAQVEKKVLEQWFIGITKYADALNEDLKALDQWPDKVKAMQKHWIGKSEGAEIRFTTNIATEIAVFTSRPDTIFSVQFLAVALDHPLVLEAKKTDSELEDFVSKCSEGDLDPESKEGYKLRDIKVSIPIGVDGAKNVSFKVPVYAAPYVLGSYGHGAVMGCPAHDIRDAEFWKLHNPDVPSLQTVGPKDKKDASENESLFTAKDGVLYDSSILKNGLPSLGIFSGLSCSKAGKKVVSCLEDVNSGQKSTQFRIRDWLISRQRYWGAPIPIIHCDSCGPVAVPDKDLPVLLPKVEGKHFGKGNPLGSIDSFVNTKCPSCGSPAKRDTDTMDTFIDSSWYFFRYADPKNTDLIFDHDKASSSIPVDLYIGGVEHAILHLLYSRFISKFLGDSGLWSGQDFRNEPIRRLVTQGMVQGKTFTDPKTGRFLKPDEVDLKGPTGPVIKANGDVPGVSFEKMSKSKYNGVDPTELINKYGTDSVRAQILFAAPVSDSLNWNEEHIQGIQRWLKKVMNMRDDVIENFKGTFKRSLACDEFSNLTINGEVIETARLNPHEFKLYNEVHFYVNRVAQSMEHDLSLNTVISDYMKLTNYLQRVIKEKQEISPHLLMDAYKKLLTIMSPVTPSVAEECWEGLSRGMGEEWKSIFWQSYPQGKVLVSPYNDYKIIVNGKKIGTVERIKSIEGLSEDRVLDALRDHELLRELLKHKKIVKVIAKKSVVSIICGSA
ncbi:hypothetical protein JCM33374_g4673 [Metschnikowia sp. JCM 33374]|nr:hypothetical protein JCM33374_g4673 [Metschnikowia sp. JCM 33374]